MKTYLYILYITTTLLLLHSCDRWKWDENGDLDGLWQMTEWRDKSTHDIIKDKHDSLYYSFQLNIMKLQYTNKATCYHSYFTRTDAELIIGKTILYPTDEERPLTDLTPYGVPTDGHFHIDVLNSKDMVLSSPSAIITFRKY